MRLIIEDLEGATTVVNLGTEEVTIGRKPHNTIQLTEQNVSRSHAKLVFRDEGWLIQDLGSYNGVKVNGVPIATPTMLRESDLIQIGDYHLTLTDDVDRATVDIERPRAANDHYGAAPVGMMSSSNELPSMSTEDLEPMRGRPNVGAQAYPQSPPQEEEKSKVGLIVGVVGVLAAVVGIVLFLSSTGDKDGDKGGGAKEAAANKGDAGKTAPPPSTGGDTPPPSSTGPEPVPEVPPTDSGSADAGAPAEDEGGEAGVDTSAAEVVPEVVPEPEPEPGPEKPAVEDKPKPKAKPKLPPDQALAEARKASMQGNNSKAYSLAKDAYDQNQSGDALNLMGVAACKMGNTSKAKAAHKKMTTKDKAMLEKLCASLGIEL